jgi:hypothetical protein
MSRLTVPIKSVVPSGGSLRVSWPLTEDYCKNILLLHWPNWRNLSEIKSDDISWLVDPEFSSEQFTMSLNKSTIAPVGSLPLHA